MTKITKTVSLLSFILFISCGQKDPNKNIDEGNVKNDIYKSPEIGWTIEIPKGWSVVSKDQIAENEEKGQKAIEKTSGQKVDVQNLKHLISFQKDKFNFFASTSEPVQEEYPGEYQKNNKMLQSLIYQTYLDNRIKADTSSGKEIIGGIEFNTFYITIYAPDSDRVLLNQIMYNKLINGYDFGVNINYNNEEAKKAMIGAFAKSKFDISKLKK